MSSSYAQLLLLSYTMFQVSICLLINHLVQIMVFILVSMFIQMIHPIITILVLQVMFLLLEQIVGSISGSFVGPSFKEFKSSFSFLVQPLVQVSVQVMPSTFIFLEVQVLTLKFVVLNICCSFDLSSFLLFGKVSFMFLSEIVFVGAVSTSTRNRSLLSVQSTLHYLHEELHNPCKKYRIPLVWVTAHSCAKYHKLLVQQPAPYLCNVLYTTRSKHWLSLWQERPLDTTIQQRKDIVHGIGYL